MRDSFNLMSLAAMMLLHLKCFGLPSTVQIPNLSPPRNRKKLDRDNVNSYRPKIESEASSALGRQVTIGNLSLSLLTGSVEADNVAIADDPAFRC
jgi:hypothetical protein